MTNPSVYKYLRDATSQTLQSKLVVDLGDRISTGLSGSVGSLVANTSTIDENQTEYALYPFQLNDPPIITKSVFDASTPKIIPIQNWSPDQKAMYIDNEKVITITKGSRVVLGVEAQQPEVLNVNNGVPEVLPPTADLTYTWYRNGTFLTSEAITEPATGSSYVIEPVDFVHAGTYTCTIQNDVGVTTTSAITLQVFNPNNTDGLLFSTNRMQNPNITSGTDGWVGSVGGVEKREFSAGQSTVQSAIDNAILNFKKLNSTTNTGYIPQMLSPYPLNVKYNTTIDPSTNTLFTHQSLIQGQGGFLTREPIVYPMADGKMEVVAYQDIDLTNTQDYISGKVWGVDGVKAYFSCYLGNAITRFLPVTDMVSKEQRETYEKYWHSAPRLTPENIVISGIPLAEEELVVYIQEYKDAELLQSTIYDPITNVELATFAPSLKDPLTEAIEYVKANNLANEPFYTQDGLAYLPPNTIANIIARAYQKLYPTNEGKIGEHYNYGQIAKQKELVISKMNSLTNKVRITLKFVIKTERAAELSEEAYNLGNMLEQETWRKITKRGVLEPYVGEEGFVIKEIKALEGYASASIQQCLLDGSVSRLLATGFNFVMHPIAPNSIANNSNNGYLSSVRYTRANNVNLRITGLIDDGPYVAKLLPGSEQLNYIKFALRVPKNPTLDENLQPNQIPNWAPTSSWLDYRDTWTVNIATQKYDLVNKQYIEDPQILSQGGINSIEASYAPVAPLNNLPHWNGYGFSPTSLVEPNNPTSINAYNERYKNSAYPIPFDVTTINLNQLKGYTRNGLYLETPPPPTRGGYAEPTIANYPPSSIVAKPTQFSLLQWSEPGYRDYWRWAVQNPDNKNLRYVKTFKVYFKLYHLNEDGSLDAVNEVVKYMVANKPITLRYADFIAETEARSAFTNFAARDYVGVRNAFIVASKMEQVFWLEPLQTTNLYTLWNTQPPAGRVYTSDNYFVESAINEQYDTTGTGLLDFAFGREDGPYKDQVFIYEYEIQSTQ